MTASSEATDDTNIHAKKIHTPDVAATLSTKSLMSHSLIHDQLDRFSDEQLDQLLKAVQKRIDLRRGSLSKRQPRRMSFGEAVKGRGAELWKQTAKAMHNYHAVAHEIQHRAQEKVGFGLAEHVLELLAEATLEQHATHHAAAHAATHVGKHVGKHAGKHAKTSIEVVQKSLGMRAWAGALSVFKLVIPLAGVVVVTQMTRHDVHRAREERRVSGLTFTTMLFILCALCDALDAIFHLLIVALLLMEFVIDGDVLHSLHMDHHAVHSLHQWGMMLAISATVSVAVGEIISSYQSIHKHGSHKASPKLKAH